jgi:hypothetical protein
MKMCSNYVDCTGSLKHSRIVAYCVVQKPVLESARSGYLPGFGISQIRKYCPDSESAGSGKYARIRNQPDQEILPGFGISQIRKLFPDPDPEFGKLKRIRNH